MALSHSPSTDRLFQAILTLQNVEDCYAFFEDLCTPNEVRDMTARLDAAFLLKAGENYEFICREVGLSTATVSRVSRFLKHGSGGYRKAIQQLETGETT